MKFSIIFILTFIQYSSVESDRFSYDMRNYDTDPANHLVPLGQDFDNFTVHFDEDEEDEDDDDTTVENDGYSFQQTDDHDSSSGGRDSYEGLGSSEGYDSFEDAKSRERIKHITPRAYLTPGRAYFERYNSHDEEDLETEARVAENPYSEEVISPESVEIVTHVSVVTQESAEVNKDSDDEITTETLMESTTLLENGLSKEGRPNFTDTVSEKALGENGSKENGYINVLNENDTVNILESPKTHSIKRHVKGYGSEAYFEDVDEDFEISDDSDAYIEIRYPNNSVESEEYIELFDDGEAGSSRESPKSRSSISAVKKYQFARNARPTLRYNEEKGRGQKLDLMFNGDKEYQEKIPIKYAANENLPVKDRDGDSQDYYMFPLL